MKIMSKQQQQKLVTLDMSLTTPPRPLTTARIPPKKLSLLVLVVVVQIRHFSKTVHVAHGRSFLSWSRLGGPEALMQQPPYRMHTQN